MQTSGQSFLALTAKAVHFWPTHCIKSALERHGVDLSRYSEVVIVGYSMGAWGAIARAHELGATKVLAFSPRTPEISVLYDEDRFGPVETMVWPARTQITILSDQEGLVEAKELGLLPSRGQFLLLRAPGSEHNSLHVFSQTKVFDLLFRLWSEGKVDAETYAKLRSLVELVQK